MCIFKHVFYLRSKENNIFDIAIMEEGWIDSKERPPEPGFIVKRWNHKNGPRLWAGFFSGDDKMSNCDAWKKISL